jgi:hypothetical protein
VKKKKLKPGPERDAVLRELASRPGATLRDVAEDARIDVTRQRASVLLRDLGLQLEPAAAVASIAPPAAPERVMTPAQLRHALDRAGLSQVEAAEELDIGRRSFRRLVQDPETPGWRRITPDMQGRIDALLAGRQARKTA